MYAGFDSDPKEVREVYGYFGRAAYEAQCLEKQIAILLSYVCPGKPDKITGSRYDELLETSLEQTFGALVKDLTSKVPLPTDINAKLKLAVEGRNWLAHNYWWDRASEFTSSAGRQKMVAELDELISLFSELDRFLTEMVRDWAFRHGITQDDFDASLNELLSATTPPRKKRRKLNKTETLVNVYSYSAGELTTLLFELDDHSFWSLCDCGLTFGPEDIDLSGLSPLPNFRHILPATIRPKPKGAKDWNYGILLSTGYCIEISPSDKRQNAFRWRLLPLTADQPK